MVEFGTQVSKTMCCAISSAAVGAIIAYTVTLGTIDTRLVMALAPTAKLRLHDSRQSIGGYHGLVRLAVNKSLPFADNRFRLTFSALNVTSA